MPITINEEKRRGGAVFVSLTAHGAVLALLLALGALESARRIVTAKPMKVSTVELAGGSHAIAALLPRMQEAAKTRNPVPNAEPAAKAILPVKPVKKEVKRGGGTPVVPHLGEGEGSAAGNGSDNEDAEPAFPIFSPRPAVSNRGLLPATAQKIVVDVKVNDQGQVVSEALVKGMGNGLDQIVLDTVKTWRFQPATVNGKPVATEAELIFPFDLKYPVG